MKNVVYVVVTALLWVLLFQLNMFVFSHFKHNLYTTWVFLPAGLRLVSVLLVDGSAILGLFIGALISYELIGLSLSASLVLSLISAINPYIAIKLSKHLLKVADMLSNLRSENLIFLSLISSLFNGITQNLYLISIGSDPHPTMGIIVMFIGDFLGCLIMLLLLAWTSKSIRKYISSSNE